MAHRYGTHESRPSLKFPVEETVKSYYRTTTKSSTGTAMCNDYPEHCARIAALAPGETFQFIVEAANPDGYAEVTIYRHYPKLLGMPKEVLHRRFSAVDDSRFYRLHPEYARVQPGSGRPRPKVRYMSPRMLRRYRKQALGAMTKKGLSRRQAAERLFTAAAESEIIDEGDED